MTLLVIGAIALIGAICFQLWHNRYFAPGDLDHRHGLGGLCIITTIMLVRIITACVEFRCTACAALATFVTDDASVFYCDRCASDLAEKMLDMLTRFYLTMVISDSPLVQ